MTPAPTNAPIRLLIADDQPISNILSKLHVTNRTQAALFALRQGIASLDRSMQNRTAQKG